MNEVENYKPGVLDYQYSLLVDLTSSDFERRQKLYAGSCLDPECTFMVHTSHSVDNEKIDLWNRCLAQYVRDSPFEIFDEYFKGYLAGIKWFEDNLKVKSPDKDHILNLLRLYNEEWKSNFKYFTAYKYFLNDIQDHGFRNGVLSAYIEYEELHLFQFKKYLPDLKTSNTKKPEIMEDKPDENILIIRVVESAGYNAEKLRAYLQDSDLKGKRLALVIHQITSKSIVENFNLKGFMSWIGKKDKYTGVHKYLQKDDYGRNEFENDDEHTNQLDKIEKTLNEFKL